MGLDSASTKFLCAAHMHGVDFSTTATLGRQGFFPDEKTLGQVFSVMKIPELPAPFIESNEFAESFISLLGADEIESFDVSDYEGATILHDMNVQIPSSLHCRFSAVFDGGTLEHVFHVTQALKNCMEMVQVGGHFLQANIANNFMGHGFWQFSPELLFRALSEPNGFQVESMLLHEVIPNGKWYSVTDPDEIHERVELCNSSPTYILTIAKRIAEVEIFSQAPQQSDYVVEWRSRDRTLPTEEALDTNSQTRQKVAVRKIVRNVLRRVFQRCCVPERPLSWFSMRGFDQQYYREIPESDVLRGRIKLSRSSKK